MDNIILDLYQKECIKIGSFKLKNGSTSPIYIDLKNLISYPYLLNQISELLYEKIKNVEVDNICAIPYGGIPITSIISSKYNIPMLFLRKELKKYGTNKLIEGIFKKDAKIILIEDVITTGSSLITNINLLKQKNVTIENIFVICDRRDYHNKNTLNEYNIHSIFTIYNILDCLLKNEKIDFSIYSNIKHFLHNQNKKSLIFEERKKITCNMLTKKIFTLLSSKKTNICFKCTETNKEKILLLINIISPHIAFFILYPDIITDINQDFLDELYKISQTKKFFIFVDRNYSNHGELFIKEYLCGININKWSDIISIQFNPDTLKTFSKINKYKRKGVIINTDKNQDQVIKIFEEYKKDTIGIITNSRTSGNDNILYFSYLNENSPEDIIFKNNCDIVIIDEKCIKNDFVKNIEIYKFLAWNAYQKKCF